MAKKVSLVVLAKERRREGRTQVTVLDLLEPSVSVSLQDKNTYFYVLSVASVEEGGQMLPYQKADKGNVFRVHA